LPAIYAVDPRSGVPIYQQIVDQVKRAIALGVLAPGEQLPTVKQLSGELVVNPNTISRAYRELERDGVVDTLPGRGSFVNENGAAEGAKRAVTDVVDQSIITAVREAKSLGVTRDRVAASFQRALENWYPGRSEEDTKP